MDIDGNKFILRGNIMNAPAKAEENFRVVGDLATIQERLMSIKSRIISANDRLSRFNLLVTGDMEVVDDSLPDEVKASEDTSLGRIVDKLSDIEYQLQALDLQLDRL